MEQTRRTHQLEMGEMGQNIQRQMDEEGINIDDFPHTDFHDANDANDANGSGTANANGSNDYESDTENEK